MTFRINAIRRLRSRGTVLVALAALGIGAALAEEALVEVNTLVVRSGKGSMYPSVGEVSKGQKLEVISREPGGWLKVRVADKEGYVKDTALKPRGATGLSGLSSAFGGTSDVGESAASRGIDEHTLSYASSNNLRTDDLERMIQSRERVAGNRWIAFTREGQVGPYKQR